MSGWESLAGLMVVRPLSMVLPPATEHGRFSATWGDTVSLLAREVNALRPREVVLEAGFHESQLRLDGLPKANSRTATDGVILSLLGTPHGDLRYPCSTFFGSGYGSKAQPGWQTNVRAIALALEALRKVDRYGVTKRGEQYAGWKQIESPQSKLVARGRAIIEQHGGDARRALAATHPDGGGDAEDFKAVSAAREAT